MLLFFRSFFFLSLAFNFVWIRFTVFAFSVLLFCARRRFFFLYLHFSFFVVIVVVFALVTMFFQSFLFTPVFVSYAQLPTSSWCVCLFLFFLFHFGSFDAGDYYGGDGDFPSFPQRVRNSVYERLVYNNSTRVHPHLHIHTLEYGQKLLIGHDGTWNMTFVDVHQKLIEESLSFIDSFDAVATQ